MTAIRLTSPQRRKRYRRIFEETLDLAIPALLFTVWGDQIKAHPLPSEQGYYDRLELTIGTGPNYVPVEEFADYKNLPKIETTEDVEPFVRILAWEAAESYAGNIKNAFIKGGRLRPNQTLHVTDWKNEFHVNIVRNVSMCPSDLIPGWIAYRYRFAAAKI